jgi:tetratricopeptide (TPR) repeat protein
MIDIQTSWGNTFKGIGNQYRVQGKIKLALKYWKRAIIIYKKIGKESLEYAKTLGNIGAILDDQDKLK